MGWQLRRFPIEEKPYQSRVMTTKRARWQTTDVGWLDSLLIRLSLKCGSKFLFHFLSLSLSRHHRNILNFRASTMLRPVRRLPVNH